MSRRGERVAREYVAAVLSTTGIQKAAGGLSPEVLTAAVLPMAEVIVSQDRFITKTARKTARALRKQNRVLRAIAAPQPSAVSPMRLPRREMVPFRPSEWRTELTPADVPVRNGHSIGAEDRNPPAMPPDGHPG